MAEVKLFSGDGEQLETVLNKKMSGMRVESIELYPTGNGTIAFILQLEDTSYISLEVVNSGINILTPYVN